MIISFGIGGAAFDREQIGVRSNLAKLGGAIGRNYFFVVKTASDATFNPL
jgi:hypothetical protein